MAELVGLGGHKEEAGAANAAALAPIRRALSAETRAKKKAEKAGVPFVRGKLPVPPEWERIVRLTRERGDKDAKYLFALIPDDVRDRYNARDALATARLGELFESQLVLEPDLRRTWDVLVQPASNSLAQIEGWGVKVSRERVQAFDAYLDLKCTDAMNQLTGFYSDVNWDSPKQVADVLYKRLKLPCPKLTKSGSDSTDKDVLELLADKHPLPAVLLRYRVFDKMRGTYAGGLLNHVRADGRVHGSYLLDGARSGRLSCVEPNLQNIPRPDTDEGKMARDCYVADDGNVLVSADYSQIELRVAAMLSGDKVMTEMFKSGADFHLSTAKLISKLAWGIEPDQVEKKHRSAAKTVNFGLIYGMFDTTLAARIGCSVGEARAVREAILGHFKDLAAWSNDQVRYARKHGHSLTYWNGRIARKRLLWHIADGDDSIRVHNEHAAVNTPVQGSAADYTLASLDAIVEWIQRDAVPSRVVLTVHDSIVQEVAREAVDEVIWNTRRIMVGWPSGDVPLAVDFEVGESWGSLASTPATGVQ
jgi:DNA polymerase I